MILLYLGGEFYATFINTNVDAKTFSSFSDDTHIDTGIDREVESTSKIANDDAQSGIDGSKDYWRRESTGVLLSLSTTKTL